MKKNFCGYIQGTELCFLPVSYTHLDVYKRQEQGFRPRSLRHGGLRRPLRSTRLGTDPVEHREAILRKKGRLNAKSCVFSTIICKGDVYKRQAYGAVHPGVDGGHPARSHLVLFRGGAAACRGEYSRGAVPAVSYTHLRGVVL